MSPKPRVNNRLSPSTNVAPSQRNLTLAFSSSRRVSLASSPNGGTASRVKVMRSLLNAVKSHQIMNEMTRHLVETHTRVSPITAITRFGKIPSADGIECYKEHSNVIIGPTDEQALTSFSTEVEERRRVPDTIVSIHNGEKEEMSSPSPSAAFTLPASISVSLSVLPACVGSHPQCPEDSISPVEVISRQQDIGVVNTRSRVSIPCSPSLEMARKQSHDPSSTLNGEGQLVRAATYIRERSSRRAPAFDEFISWTPRTPPDKVTESDVQRRVIPGVVSGSEKVSTIMCSPESMAESLLVVPSHSQPESAEESPSIVLSCSQSKAAQLQPHGEVETPPLQPETPRANELSTEFPKSVPRNTDPMRDTLIVGVQESHSIQPIVAAEMDRCSHEHLAEAKKASEELVMLAHMETMKLSCENFISETGTMCARLHSPISATTLTKPPPASLLHANSLGRPSAELVWFHLAALGDRGPRWCPYGAVSSLLPLNIEQHPPFLLKMGLPHVSRPDYAGADPTSHPSSLELVWWGHTKPPNMAAYRRFLYETVNALSKRVGSATYPGRPLTPLNATPPLSLMFFVSAALALRCSLRMPCGVHLLIISNPWDCSRVFQSAPECHGALKLL